MEKKRRQEAHEKIVFGGIVIALLKDLQKKNDPMAMKIIDMILNSNQIINSKNMDIILSITNRIRLTK